jgi:hypothetical protein
VDHERGAPCPASARDSHGLALLFGRLIILAPREHAARCEIVLASDFTPLIQASPQPGDPADVGETLEANQA